MCMDILDTGAILQDTIAQVNAHVFSHSHYRQRQGSMFHLPPPSDGPTGQSLCPLAQSSTYPYITRYILALLTLTLKMEAASSSEMLIYS